MWTEGPILPELPPPPVDRIQVRGAQLAQIYDPPGTKLMLGGRPRPDGGREAVVLAWARIPGGGWAVLLAWTSYAKLNARGTALARCGWYRHDPQRVKPKAPPRYLDDEAQWHGWHEMSELHQAILEAATLLPEDMREAALTPRRERPQAPPAGPQG